MRPSSGIDPSAYADVTTVLLIGGDAGPGRWSLRTDTMMLFSIHRTVWPRRARVGATQPRAHAVPGGARWDARYPNGFTDLANAVYPTVQSRPELRAAYDGIEGVEPGVVALAEGIGYSLDVTIDDYVIVDMRGFVTLRRRARWRHRRRPRPVEMPGNIPGAPTQYPEVIGPGVIFMDGSTALGYARSRSMDSDYQRTARQRHLLAALAVQFSMLDVLRVVRCHRRRSRRGVAHVTHPRRAGQHDGGVRGSVGDRRVGRAGAAARQRRGVPTGRAPPVSPPRCAVALATGTPSGW